MHAYLFRAEPEGHRALRPDKGYLVDDNQNIATRAGKASGRNPEPDATRRQTCIAKREARF